MEGGVRLEHERCRLLSQPFEAFWPSSGPRPVGRGLSPEFVLRMVKRQPLDDKRYFFSLR
jgi:hypothetical protein